MTSTRDQTCSPRPFEETVAWHKSVLQNRGALASLRRTDCSLDFSLVPAFHRLGEALRKQAKVSPPNVALIAKVLVSVKTHSEEPIGRSLKRGNVSEARLRRLLHSESRDELGEQLRSLALRLHSLNVREIAETIVYWGESRAARIAQDYFVDETHGKDADAAVETST